VAPKQHLLALDGDDAVLKTIARIAAPYYQVLTTRDPRKFLAFLENATLDIAAVLTEHVLQTSNGVSLLESVRTTRPSARRVLLTTYHDLASIVDGLHSGAIERLVQKPFTPRELICAILPENNAGETTQRVSA
jgi:ActR/RegA family two-component response regulator